MELPGVQFESQGQSSRSRELPLPPVFLSLWNLLKRSTEAVLTTHRVKRLVQRRAERL